MQQSNNFNLPLHPNKLIGLQYLTGFKKHPVCPQLEGAQKADLNLDLILILSIFLERDNMWKKNDDAPVKPKQADQTNAPFQTPKAAERSVMGSTLSFKGEIFGEETLVIQSEVEGLVDLRKNSVTIGRNGRLKADLYGKSVTIEGKVIGNIVGFDSVRITQTGSVKGNVTSPRVTLEDGARFKGSIDMEMPRNKTADDKPVLPNAPKITPANDIVKPKTI